MYQYRYKWDGYFMRCLHVGGSCYIPVPDCRGWGGVGYAINWGVVVLNSLRVGVGVGDLV